MKLPYLSIMIKRNDPLPASEIAELISFYANNPDIQMDRLGKMFGVCASTAWGYIGKHYFGWIKGQKITIVLQSKINKPNEIYEWG